MRNINQIAIVSSVLISLLSCSKDKDVDVNPGTTTNPVEGNAANTTYKPAFEGQTRINGVQTNTTYEGVVIATTLTSPWGITSLPDGRLLITEKTGTMRIATTTGVVSSPITGIPAVNSAGQGGLLGLCIDPDFITNRMIYWVFAEATTGGNNTAVAKGKLAADEKIIEGATVIYRAKPANASTLHYGGRILFDKTGFLVVTTGVVSSPITGIPAVNSAGQGGLLGLCIDPDFITNRMIYWVFAEATTGGNNTVVAKGKLAADEKTIEGATVIYRAKPANASTLHYGGRILFDKTGFLVVTTGERSVLETRPLAQSVTTGLGKVVRITKEGQPATGNPIFTQAGALPELYSIGHRNPQGLALNPVTNEIWLAEHGPRGGDEINRIKAGANYGWPTITYGIEYSGEKIGAGIQQQDGLEQPVYYWDPVVSPSGMTFYTGNRVPEWQNNLFIGALSGMHIVRLAIKDNKVVGEERLLASENQRFRDVTQGKDGALYAVTDGGRLYKIDKK